MEQKWAYIIFSAFADLTYYNLLLILIFFHILCSYARQNPHLCYIHFSHVFYLCFNYAVKHSASHESP